MKIVDHTKADNADQYIDRIIVMLREGDASEVAIDLTDKTLRSYLHILDANHESDNDATEMLTATLSVIATIVENVMLRVTGPDKEAQLEFLQWIVEELATRLVESHMVQHGGPADQMGPAH